MVAVESNPTSEEYVKPETIIGLPIDDEPNSKSMLTLAAFVLSTAAIVGPNPLSTKNNVLELETTPVYIESEATLNELHGDRQDNKAIQRIRELGLYNENWDGVGGIPPTSQAINEAEQFLRALLGRNIMLPHISLAADGEINFLWKLNDIRFDLGFYGDQTYSYYGKDKDGNEYMEDEASILSALPEKIVNLFR